MLENAIFTGITTAAGLGLSAAEFRVGAAAGDASDRIIYNSTTGGLFYDSDGTGAAAQVQFAVLSPGLAITQSEFVIA